MSLRIILIAAIDQQSGIGQQDQLLWHCAQDQQHFKQTTLGSPVIMGRQTWDSLPERFRPLPGRDNWVLTRQPAWQAPGAQRASSLAQVRQALADQPKAYVIGGAQLYALALPWADELVLTEIHATFEKADTFFPAWRQADFTEVARQTHVDAAQRRFDFVTYRRLS